MECLSRDRAHIRNQRGETGFHTRTLIAFANANSAGDCERRRGNPMQLLQGFEKDLCHRALMCTHVAYDSRNARRGDVQYARNEICARPSTGMWHSTGTGRWLSIASHRVRDKRALLIRVNNHR